MRRSTEFDATMKYGMRTVQPDVIVHVQRADDDGKTRREVGESVEQFLNHLAPPR